jgi:aryl sulfotransferase
VTEARKFVWLASYPKSGNTWLRVFLANLLHGGNEPVDINQVDVLSAADRSLFDSNTGLASSDLTPTEIARLRPGVFRVASRHPPSARRVGPLLVKTHEAFALSPDGGPIFPPEVTRAAIYVVRNPLDVAVSLSHHTGRTPMECVNDMNDDRLVVRRQATGCAPRLPEFWSSWGGNVRSWTSRDDLPLTVIRYEDMKEHPLETFMKAARAVVPGRTEEQVGRAVDLSRFELLATQEAAAGFRERPPESRRFFRRGIVGSWRSELGAAEIDAVVEKHGALMERFGYTLGDY